MGTPFSSPPKAIFWLLIQAGFLGFVCSHAMGLGDETASPDTSRSNEREKLTTVEEIASWQQAQSQGQAKLCSVEVEGWVTYVDPERSRLYLQDENGRAVPLKIDRPMIVDRVKYGSAIRCVGKSVASKGTIEIQGIELLADENRLAGRPFPNTEREIANRVGCYVFAEGRVQEVAILPRELHLMITTREGPVWIRCTDPPDDREVKTWLGQNIRAEGAIMPLFLLNGDPYGFRINSMSRLQIVAKESDFQPILTQALQSRENTKVVHGVVEAFDVDRTLFVSGESVRTSHAYLFKCGAKIKATSITLPEATSSPFVFIKQDSHALHEISKPIVVNDGIDGLGRGDRITIQGFVHRWRKLDYHTECLIESGKMTYLVLCHLPESQTVESGYAELTPGSLVSITGVLASASSRAVPTRPIRVYVGRRQDVSVVRSHAMFLNDRLYGWLVGLSLFAGGALGWVAILRRRVRAQSRAVKESATLMKASVSSMPDGIFLFNLEKKLLAFNESAKNFVTGELRVGMTATETLAALESHLGVADGSELHGFWEENSRESTTRGEREWNTNGGTRWIHVTTGPIQEGNRHSIGRIWTFRDTTELHELQNQNAMLERLNALGRLAGGVAHDFNNLLTAISANLTLAKVHAGDRESQATYIDIAQLAVDRAAHIIRQLHDYARQAPLRLQPTDPVEIVGRAQDLVCHSLKASIQFSSIIQPNLRACLADAPRLEQVLLNLCLNARDALRDDYGTIRLEAANAHHSTLGDCVCFSVEDNGEGIPPENRAKIFEPFFTTKALGAGTGLGLSTAQKIVELHGGRLEVESTVGKGTRFLVYIPVAEETADHEGKSYSPRSSGAVPASSSLRILLVDDDPLVREGGAHLLQALGHQVVCCEDGRVALDRLKQDAHFDLILLDLTMPVLSGRETLQAIRQAFPHLRVILCSGYSLDRIANAPQERIQPDGFLVKPFRLDELKDALRGTHAGFLGTTGSLDGTA